MAQLLALIEAVVGWVQRILGLVQAVQDVVTTIERDDIPAIAGDVSTAIGESFAASPAAVAIIDDIVTALKTTTPDSHADILAAIALLTPVTLPDHAPSTLYAEGASAVWSLNPSPQQYTDAVNTTQLTTQSMLANIYQALAYIYYSSGLAVPGHRWFRYHWTANTVGRPMLYYDMDAHLGAGLLGRAMFSDAHAGETVALYLARVTSQAWEDARYDAGPLGYGPYAWLPLTIDAGDRIEWLECQITEREMWQLSGVSGVASAPTWPGLDGVTLGDAVALADRVVIDTPLDGLLVNVTAPPTGLGKFQVGSQSFWYRLGQLYFVTDRGDVEAAQPLGCGNAIYVPRTMGHAAGALLRVKGGPVGTVTPWTLL
jgi:hypothetical protein